LREKTGGRAPDTERKAEKGGKSWLTG